MAEFKVGDKVLYSDGMKRCITVITKVTPKGAVRVECDNGHSLFSQDGRCKGRYNEWSNYIPKIEAITAEQEEKLRAEFRLNNTIQKCSELFDEKMKAKKISIEQAVAIIKILSKGDDK